MRWMLLALPLVLLIDCITFVNFFSWHEQSVYEYQQRQLDLQVNYAVQAAAQEMLESGTNIDTDYINWGQMTVEPEIALNTYTNILLKNLGWSDHGDNREAIVESAMPFFMVAANDGYYLYCRQREETTTTLPADGRIISQSVYNKHWTPKLPYSEFKNNKAYFYYLNSDNYGTCNLNDQTSALIGVKRELPYDNNITKEHGKIVISQTISDALNTALYLGMEGNTDVVYYIPAEMSTWTRTPSVETPTVITYMTPLDESFKYNVASFGIGGAKIDDVDFVICYTLGASNDYSDKRYAWASDRDALASYYGSSNIHVREVMTSSKEAAKEGYYYDYSYYNR